MCFSWIYTVETDQSEQNLTTAAGVWKVATAQRNTLEQVLYGTISAWPGTLPLLRKLKAMKVPMAIATSSPRSLSWLGGMLWVEFVGEIGTISQFLETLPQKVTDTRKYRKWFELPLERWSSGCLLAGMLRKRHRGFYTFYTLWRSDVFCSIYFNGTVYTSSRSRY